MDGIKKLIIVMLHNINPKRNGKRGMPVSQMIFVVYLKQD